MMGDGTHLYNLYGLRVLSEVPLPAPTAPDDSPPYDWHVRWGERRPVAADAPAGQILARSVHDGGEGKTIVDNGSGYTYRFHHTADFLIDRDLRSVRVHLAPHVRPDFASLLIVGNVMTIIFTLGGEPVLHASAVEVGGSALAFLGDSGAGKSSLAALLCAGGGRFVTDDLLRLRPDGGGWLCYPGAGELRLRRHAAALTANFPAPALGTTADDRISVRVDADCSMPHLGAIVVPHLSRSCDALKVERVPQAQALLYLMAYTRMKEPTRGERLRRRLDWLGRVAARVPLFEAKIPWGLPPPEGMVSALVRGVGLTPGA